MFIHIITEMQRIPIIEVMPVLTAFKMMIGHIHQLLSDYGKHIQNKCDGMKQ